MVIYQFYGDVFQTSMACICVLSKYGAILDDQSSLNMSLNIVTHGFCTFPKSAMQGADLISKFSIDSI